MTKDLTAATAMRSWTELTRDIKGIPTEFAAAIMSGRPELARLIRRPMTLEETRAVADALIVFIETNQQLQKHSAAVAQQVLNLQSHAKGLMRSIGAIRALAEFRGDDGSEDDDE